MTYPNPSTALATLVVDELVRAGVRLAVASPGSRSTAVTLALAARPEVDTVVSIDERSGSFHALGYAKATDSPAAVVTTSGTAVANMMPAVVEADAAGIPLVIVSTDRPPEMRGVGANQTIDQSAMFDRFVRAARELGPAELHPDAPRWWRSQVAQVVATARGWSGRPGPVHFNLAFREPTVPVADDGRTPTEPYPYDAPGRPDGRPWTSGVTPGGVGDDAVEAVADAVSNVSRGIVVAGGGTASGSAVAEVGARLGWPVVATAESGLRGRPGVIATGHHLLAHLPEPPEIVLRFGDPGPSQRLVGLSESDVPHIVVGRRWSDPFRWADTVVAGDPPAVAGALLGVLDDDRPYSPHLRWWRAADEAVTAALVAELGGVATEPGVAHHLGHLGADAVAVGSSMPIRDVEAYAFELPRLVANRGASGIDGFVSTALGMARASHHPVALAGDLSMLHDSNGFLLEPRPACVFVVVDNHGGGIFSFLPQADHAGRDFERLFSTPPRRDLAAFGAFHGLAVTRAGTIPELREAVGELDGIGGLVVVDTDRDQNVAEHRRLEAIAAEAIAGVSRTRGRPSSPPA